MNTKPDGKQSASLGLISLVAIVVANMIGVGVFTSSGFSLAALGNPSRVLFAWALCGLWAICGAIAYGSLVARLPHSGGEYLFLARLVHPAAGFLAGWISLIAGFTAPIALAAKNAALHLLDQTQSVDLHVSLLAAGLILLACTSHLIGLRLGTWLQNCIVMLKLLLLAWIIWVAFVWTPSAAWSGGPLPDRDPDMLPESLLAWWALAGSSSWLALSYTGFNAAIYIAGESRNASRLVPRAMILGTIIVTIFYLLMNYVFVFFPAPELLVGPQGTGQERVAAVVAQALGGQQLYEIVRLVVVLATTSSVFVMLMLGPRVYGQMAVDGLFPPLFAAADFRAAIVLQAVASILVCFAGSILEIMTYLGLALTACGALTICSLFWIGRKLPASTKLNWIERLSIAGYLSLSAILIVATCQQRPQQFLALLATLAAGIAIYLWMDRQDSKET